MNAEESMNKSPDEKNASDTGTPREMAEPLQAGPAQSEVIERRSPHRVISTASYYHLERRRRQFVSAGDARLAVNPMNLPRDWKPRMKWMAVPGKQASVSKQVWQEMAMKHGN